MEDIFVIDELEIDLIIKLQDYIKNSGVKIFYLLLLHLLQMMLLYYILKIN